MPITEDILIIILSIVKKLLNLVTDIIDCKISLENPTNFGERRILDFSKKYCNKSGH